MKSSRCPGNRPGYEAQPRLQSRNMADAAESSSSDNDCPDEDCPDKNVSDRDSSDGSTDFQADFNFSSENQNSVRDPKSARSTLYAGKKKQKATAKQKWKRRFRYSSFKQFLRYTMAVYERQADESPSPREKKKQEESDGFYADDTGYLQGKLYDQLENGEEIGFTGDVSRKLNLIPPLTSQDRTSEDAELLRTDFQSDTDNPEIIVVPCAQFVREISSELK